MSCTAFYFCASGFSGKKGLFHTLHSGEFYLRHFAARKSNAFKNVNRGYIKKTPGKPVPGVFSALLVSALVKTGQERLGALVLRIAKHLFRRAAFYD